MPKKINTFYLGTAVKLTITIDVSTATSALITIDDPTEIEKISDANMTKEADGVYTYTYQSLNTDTAGDYVVTFEITYGGYTAVTQETFRLIDQE